VFFVFLEDTDHYEEEQDEGEQMSEEEQHALSQTFQNKAVVLALYQMFSPAVGSDEVEVFEKMLCDCFDDINVGVILEENLQNQESRAAGVRLDLQDEDDEEESDNIAEEKGF
jgi:hypothetical protein